MNMLAVEDIRTKLLALKGHYLVLATLSGLSHSWLCKFAQGSQQNPTYKSIVALTAAIDAFERGERA